MKAKKHIRLSVIAYPHASPFEHFSLSVTICPVDVPKHKTRTGHTPDAHALLICRYRATSHSIFSLSRREEDSLKIRHKTRIEGHYPSHIKLV